MAKIYVTYEKPQINDGKISIYAEVVTLGDSKVPQLGVTVDFTGEPTAIQIINDVRALVLREVNVYAVPALNASAIVSFCAPG